MLFQTWLTLSLIMIRAHACQRIKSSTRLPAAAGLPQPAGVLHPSELPNLKWQSMNMDLITALPRTRKVLIPFGLLWIGCLSLHTLLLPLVGLVPKILRNYVGTHVYLVNTFHFAWFPYGTCDR